ncbi:hypothetical protein AB1Y20_016666 [Prymnesium parvum]|uniref:G2/mitotic-specific cyclin-B3 n=1 Tax=Prymnesium parvum TaxID=97485 RepID=A0AB34IAP1_PRYPA
MALRGAETAREAGRQGMRDPVRDPLRDVVRDAFMRELTLGGREGGDRGREGGRAPLHDISNKAAISSSMVEKSALQPANVRLTRQAAAKQRALLQQLLQAEHKGEGEQMKVDLPLDALEMKDAVQCHHYVREIFAYLRQLELQHRVSPHFMQSQRDINATMRSILIDWLVEVAEEYRLVPETLYLAVNYIDRFLAHVPVNRSRLQLVGVTCMLIASKFEEIHPPAVDEFVYISDNTYKREEILHMEGMVLNRLEFELSVATTRAFLNRFLNVARAGECDQTTEKLCEYLCELTLQEYAFVKYRPSEIAAAALRMALHTMRLPSWSPMLQDVSGYAIEQLQNCCVEMYAVFRKASTNNLQAVREKYAHAKFLCVATLSPPETCV